MWIFSWGRSVAGPGFKAQRVWPRLFAQETRRRQRSGCIWGPGPTWPQELDHGPALRRPQAFPGPWLRSLSWPVVCPVPTLPQRTRGFATATLKSLNLHPPPLAKLSSEDCPWRLEKPRGGGSGGPVVAALCGAPARSAPPSPGSTPLLRPGNWSLWGVPRAESACLFKRPRGAPCEPPRAGGGGHGRGRLAPGGPGSTTKLRPLSLRIGRAPQTGGGRALSSPSRSQVLGAGVGRARAPAWVPARAACALRSRNKETRKDRLDRLVPRYRARLGFPPVLGPFTFCEVKGHC